MTAWEWARTIRWRRSAKFILALVSLSVGSAVLNHVCGVERIEGWQGWVYDTPIAVKGMLIWVWVTE